jgi:hypothetical protein
VEIQCFWLEATLTARRSLRRYASLPDDGRCGRYSGHNAQTPIDVVPFQIKAMKYRPEYQTFDYLGADRLEIFDRSDERWPLKCESCEYRFLEGDSWQIFMDEIYERTDTGERLALPDVPPGAMWDAWVAALSGLCSCGAVRDRPQACPWPFRLFPQLNSRQTATFWAKHMFAHKEPHLRLRT